MSISIVPNKHSNVSKKEQVQNMFDEIAHKYDFLNHLLSFNIDKKWRTEVLRILKPLQPQKILDVATGTADLAIALSSLNPTEIIGVDISRKMLDIGEEKIVQKKLNHIITLEQGDSENLKYESNTFDAVTVAFGVRNFEHLELGLQEINRVLKPGGTFIILEFSKVKKFPMKQFYQFYSRFIMPTVGKFFSKSTTAYAYLPSSVQVFPEGEELCLILQRVGFKQTTCKVQTFGIATIYLAKK